MFMKINHERKSIINLTFASEFETIRSNDERRLWKFTRKLVRRNRNNIVSGLERPVNIMCRIRTFYECSDGTMGFAEMVLSYDEDIAAHIRHLSTGGRMVITEHIDLV